MNELRQLDLTHDLPRGEQLTLLRCIRLKSFNTLAGENVSAAMQKALLKEIDGHDGNGKGCFASQETLADEIGCSVTTIGRAVQALVARCFITIERDKRTGTNNHRIVWNELRLFHLNQVGRSVVTTDANRRDDSSRTVVATDANCRDDGSRTVVATDANCRDDGQNETETQRLNATSTATDESGWLLLRGQLRDLGMKAATQATSAARKHGLPLDYIDELIREARERYGRPDEPGGTDHLCNWLTGKTFPPIDETDAARLRSERFARQRVQAEAIRQRIASEPKLTEATDDVKAGWVGRLLAREGLETEATDDERAAAARLDELDRQRDANRQRETIGAGVTS